MCGRAFLANLSANPRATCGRTQRTARVVKHVLYAPKYWRHRVAMAETAVLNLINRRVRLRLRDVCIPDVDELLATLYGEQIVEGTIVDMSDSGDTRQAFAVVQLVGVEKPVVVPLQLILSISDHGE